jgi:hypothetical protein
VTFCPTSNSANRRSSARVSLPGCEYSIVGAVYSSLRREWTLFASSSALQPVSISGKRAEVLKC